MYECILYVQKLKLNKKRTYCWKLFKGYWYQGDHAYKSNKNQYLGRLKLKFDDQNKENKLSYCKYYIY